MSRLVLFIVALIVLVGGGLFLLSGRDAQRPVAPVEKQVDLANLQ